MGMALHFDVSFFGASKWKLLICQSTCGLSKKNQDNPMMIGFVGDEMTLKINFLVCNPMVIHNALVSYVISFEERFWPLITSIATSMVFFIKGNLSCRTNSLSMKHVNASKSSNASIFIVMDLLHLITIDNKKQGVGSKYRLRSSQSHNASKSCLTIPTKIRRPHFPNLQNGG
jgi:hypothetical protein